MSCFSALVRVPAKGKRAARVRALACIVAAIAGVEQEGIAARIKSEACWFLVNEATAILFIQVTRDENPVIPSQRITRAQQLQVIHPVITSHV